MTTDEQARFPFQPDYAVPPGRTLHETIDHLGIDRPKLVALTGLSVQKIHELVEGDSELTPDVAVQLERVTGLPAQTWNNLEANYRKQRARPERT